MRPSFHRAPSFIMRNTERHALESGAHDVADAARFPSTQCRPLGPHIADALRGVKSAQQPDVPCRSQVLADNTKEEDVGCMAIKTADALTGTIPSQRGRWADTIFRIVSRSSSRLYLTIFHSIRARLSHLA